MFVPETLKKVTATLLVLVNDCHIILEYASPEYN